VEIAGPGASGPVGETPKLTTTPTGPLALMVLVPLMGAVAALAVLLIKRRGSRPRT